MWATYLNVHKHVNNEFAHNYFGRRCLCNMNVSFKEKGGWKIYPGKSMSTKKLTKCLESNYFWIFAVSQSVGYMVERHSIFRNMHCFVDKQIRELLRFCTENKKIWRRFKRSDEDDVFSTVAILLDISCSFYLFYLSLLPAVMLPVLFE